MQGKQQYSHDSESLILEAGRINLMNESLL